VFARADATIVVEALIASYGAPSLGYLIGVTRLPHRGDMKLVLESVNEARRRRVS
jgi:hypothetical protein